MPHPTKSLARQLFANITAQTAGTIKYANVSSTPAIRTKLTTTSEGSGKKVAAKYRNPETGTTWSGRGITPKWLLGKDKADLLIK